MGETRWWFAPAAEVPRGEAEQTDWLYPCWECIDEWINTTGRATKEQSDRH
jgi:hypothetical protein